MLPPTADPSGPSPEVDAARERVVHLLTDRFADGSLTTAAFEAQLDRMYALRDAPALDAMARELAFPNLPAPSPTQPVAPPGAPAADLAWRYGTYLPARVGERGGVFGLMSAVHRRGEWNVPRRLRVLAVMSEVVLDLRDALLPADGCEIEVVALMANVRVLVPAEADARVDVSAVMGAARDRTRGGPRGRPGPRVAVTGTALMAEVVVRGD